MSNFMSCVFCTKITTYICKKCSEEHTVYQSQMLFEDGHYEDIGPMQNRIPEKCIFCGSTSFAVGSYHQDERNNDNIEERNAYYALLKSVRRQPEFDPTLYQALIESRKASRAAQMARYQASVNAPKCPSCGSTDIRDISTLNRLVSVGLFGLASGKIGKTKECKKCGYKW